MAKNKFRIGADINGAVRRNILDRFPPRFSTIWCKTITMAYGVTADFEFSSAPVDVEIYGYHCGDGHDCVLLRINGQPTRPDGKPWHITLSAAPDIGPASGGDIDMEEVEYLNPFSEILFQTKFFRNPLWVMKPTSVAA